MKVLFFDNYFLLTKNVVLPNPGSRESLRERGSRVEGSLYVREKHLAKSRSVGCPWELLYAWCPKDGIVGQVGNLVII